MREFGSLLLVVILGHLTGNVQTNGSSRAERSVSGCHVEPPAAKSPEVAQSILHGYGGSRTTAVMAIEINKYVN